jgi:hypothetical protein
MMRAFDRFVIYKNKGRKTLSNSLFKNILTEKKCNGTNV